MSDQEDGATRAAQILVDRSGDHWIPSRDEIAQIIREEAAPFSTARVLGENSRLQFKIKHLLEALEWIADPDSDHHEFAEIALNAISKHEGRTPFPGSTPPEPELPPCRVCGKKPYTKPSVYGGFWIGCKSSGNPVCYEFRGRNEAHVISCWILTMSPILDEANLAKCYKSLEVAQERIEELGKIADRGCLVANTMRGLQCDDVERGWPEADWCSPCIARVAIAETKGKS